MRLFTRQVFCATLWFSSDIVETLPTYYFMLLEYMCEVSKILTVQKSRKLSVKKIEKEHEIPYSSRKLNYIVHRHSK